MSFARLPERYHSHQFATELARLRALFRRPPVSRELAIAQARECGRRAYAAGHPLELLVEALAAVVPDDANEVRTLPTEIVDAGATAYLDLADRPPGLMLD